MKRRISELLDGMQEDTVVLEEFSPLSAQRIKEMTMKKVTKKKPSRRILSKALLAAALLMVLAVTALAREMLTPGDWFRDIFGTVEENDGNLEAQLAYIDQIGKVYHESLESQGTTLTPLAGYGDENVFYLRLKIAGPEGSVLPDDPYYSFYGSWEQEETTIDNPELYDWLFSLPDENPKDNEKEFLLQVNAFPEAQQKLNSGNPVLYHIYGLYRPLPSEAGLPKYEQVLPGEFTLDLSYFNQVEMVDLDVEGLSYHRDVVGIEANLEGKKEVPYEYTVTFSQMQISPLSISWVCDYQMSDPTWKAGVEIQVILKDGTKAAIQYGLGTGFEAGHPLAASRQSGYFQVPIDLEEVDYILIGDSHKVYIPG